MSKIQKTISVFGYGALIVNVVNFGAKLAKKDIAMVDRIIAKTEVTAKNYKNVLVIDDFIKSDIDIDADFIGDVAHGFVTSRIIENGLDSVNVIKRNTLGNNKGYHYLMGKQNIAGDSLNVVLGKIFEESKNVKKYDAINLSFGIGVKFEKLSKALGINITPENISSISKTIKNNLKHPKDNISLQGVPLDEIGQIVDKMDSISSRGTRFYISAGNEGKESVNLFNLVDNAYNVGALEKNGQKANFSADNSLVNRWEISDLDIKKTKNGFDITGHGKTDVHYDETTFFRKEKFGGFYRLPLQGTSYSAPKALVRDFTNRVY